MPFSRPTLSELIDRTFSDITSRLSFPAAILRRSVVGVLARVLAGASHMLHGHIEYIAREAIPDTAVDTLSRWAAIWGIIRKEAEFAEGAVSFVGANGSVIPAGTFLSRSDGAQYATVADAVIAGGVAAAYVLAAEAGALGNTSAGTVLSLVNPIVGVNSSAAVAAGGLTNGTEPEGDDSLRARMLSRIQSPQHGGTMIDYREWALEVPGVTRAWVYPSLMGIGSVGVTFVRDDDDSIIPSAAEVLAVQDFIDEVRPVTADVFVFAPTPLPVNFTIAVAPNSAVVRDAVFAELEDFIRREASPGGSLDLSRIREAISLSIGEQSHNLIYPVANVRQGATELAVMGVVTWQ